MAKTNNLKDFLVDLYEGIVSKKPNASRNPQDFRSEIESISGGATIKSGGGTPVPNSGYVENVYLNTNLSVEEVVSILKQMNIENGYLVFLSQNEEGAIIGYNMAGLNEYIIADSNNNVYFSDVDGGWGFIGWNTNITNPIAVNSEVLSEIGSTTIGTQNDKLSNIFSTTPFTNETIELSGEYDGSTIEVTDLSGGWQGTPVPNNEYIENVYFNTNLSVDEVINLLGQLEYDDSHIYVPIANADISNGIMIMYDGGDCFIQNAITQEYYFISSLSIAGHLGADFEGWNTIYKDYIMPFNSTAVEGGDGLVIGNQNDKLSSLFSTTPFTRTEENTINIKKYINEKKIPLSIKVNVDTGAGGGTGGGGSEDYPSEAIAYYKQTRNKDYPYFPLPYEMEEEQDTIYMLYDATGYMCCPAFDITYTDCVVTVQKYMNTTLISEYTLNDVVSNSTYYMQFSEEDSDYSTYNYIVIKMQGNITKHSLAVFPKFNGRNYARETSDELIEVSGKCNACRASFSQRGSYGSHYYHYRAEYYSFTGISEFMNYGYGVGLFLNCYNLICVPELDISNLQDAQYFFNNCYNLICVPELDMSSCTNMNYMFSNCSSLRGVSLVNTNLVKYVENAFSGCSSLQEIQLDMSSCTRASNMFANCYSLREVSLVNTSQITNMQYMCNNCYSLTIIDQFDTSSLTNMYQTFYNCQSLLTIPQIDVSKVTSIYGAFTNCNKLIDINMYNMKISFDLTQSAMVSQNELVKILNNLGTVETTQTLTLGSKLLAKLTDEDIAIAQNKGWSVA